MLINPYEPTKPPKFINILQGIITPWVDNGLYCVVDRKLGQPMKATLTRLKPVRLEFFTTPLPPNPRNLRVPYLPFIL